MNIDDDDDLKIRSLQLKMEMRDKKKWSDRVGNVFEASGKPWDDSVKMAIKAKLAGLVAAKPEAALAIQKRGVIDNLGQTLLDKLGSLPTDNSEASSSVAG